MPDKLTKPELPGITIFFNLLGALGLIASAIIAIPSPDASGIGVNLHLATAASSAFGSLICFAAGSVIARLAEIAFYQRALYDNQSLISAEQSVVDSSSQVAVEMKTGLPA